ncbi:MAG: twin-arginine translocase subunit TatC [Egibacteraceae bacterium]
MATTSSKTAKGSSDTYLGEEMTLFEHLNELRQRIVKAALGIAVGFAIGFAVRSEVLDRIRAPYCGLDIALRQASTGECNLAIIRVLDPFFVSLKTSAIIAVLIGGPVTCYQIWRFVTPGLRPVERRFTLPFIVLSALLFVVGGLFAYLVLPRGLEFLLGFAGDGFNLVLSLNEYVDFMLKTMLGFGLAFQFPLAIAIFTLMGVVGSDGLRRYRRHAIFGTFVLAAVITPTQDPFTMVVMALPLTVMYEGNIIFARLVERSRRRRASSELALPE